MVRSWASHVAQMVKNPPANAEDLSSIPGSGRSPGRGHGNPLQYSCLENPMDRTAWQAYIPWGYKESNTTERLSLFFHILGFELMLLFFLIILFIICFFFFFSVLGVLCCVQALSGCREKGLLSSCSARASHWWVLFVVEHRVEAHGPSCCGSQA